MLRNNKTHPEAHGGMTKFVGVNQHVFNGGEVCVLFIITIRSGVHKNAETLTGVVSFSVYHPFDGSAFVRRS